MLKKLWVLPLDIRLAAHTNKLQFRPRSYSYIGNVPVIDVFDRPIADWDVVMKWLFDKIIGSALLLASLPVLALVAIAIKLDSRGPVFFKQKRYGFNNDLIEVYKFRSMYVEAADATASKLVTKDDPRVTRVGRFIRKASLDELPQLFNVVFKGNLSLVGPRPHAVNAKAEARLYAEAVDGYFARHRVKPGITGWAQINGWRGETDTQEKIQKRVEHDLYYIENWSVLFDLYILVRTPFALLKIRERLLITARDMAVAGARRPWPCRRSMPLAPAGDPGAGHRPARTHPADRCCTSPCWPVRVAVIEPSPHDAHDGRAAGRLPDRRRPLRSPAGRAVPAAADVERRRADVADERAGRREDRAVRRDVGLSRSRRDDLCPCAHRATPRPASARSRSAYVLTATLGGAGRHRRLFQPVPRRARTVRHQ